MSDEIDGKRVGPHDVNRALRNLEAAKNSPAMPASNAWN
jgi:hypothetical protein